MAALTDYFVPVASWVKDRLMGKSQMSALEVRAEIMSRIERARRSAKEDGVDEKVFEAGLFPVVVWIDEILMCTEWPGANEWRSMLLQKAHFKIVNGGVEFFRRLSALGPEPVDREIMGIYYMILHLGFQGQLGMKGGESGSIQVRQRLQNLLEPARNPEGEFLFAGVLPAPAALSGKSPEISLQKRRVKTFLLWGAPPLVLLILYAVFDRIIHHMVQNVLTHLN